MLYVLREYIFQKEVNQIDGTCLMSPNKLRINLEPLNRCCFGQKPLQKSEGKKAGRPKPCDVASLGRNAPEPPDAKAMQPFAPHVKSSLVGISERCAKWRRPTPKNVYYMHLYAYIFKMFIKKMKNKQTHELLNSQPKPNFRSLIFLIKKSQMIRTKLTLHGRASGSNMAGQ